MKNLTALIDGSKYSESVCDHAHWFASRSGAAVDVVHVLGRRETPMDLSGSIGLGARTTLLDELSELDAEKARLAQKRGRALLEYASDRLAAAGTEKVTTRLRHGVVVETVQALEKETDLIVIGKRGEAADFARLHLGSNLERVVRSSDVPVFVASRAFKPIEKVLIAFDGGESALKGIDYIAASPVAQGLEFMLLTVGEENKEHQKALDTAAVKLRAAGLKAETQILQGQADIIIAGDVENSGYDLLVMGAYGHSRIRNMIIGSTTTEMIRFSPVPVLLFR
jgi:nucleotide-binding universal stress UspA family protein